MNLLLDTSIFLWYIAGDKKLLKKYADEIFINYKSTIINPRGI